MAVSLRKYLNSKLKEKGLTLKEAKKNASKYKSIAAAKKAGSLYYTNKDGKVMAAVYAEDLKKPIKPKARPDSSKITVEVQLKNCTFEKLQFFTVDLSSLYFLQVKNCNFSIIFNVVYFAWN